MEIEVTYLAAMIEFAAARYAAGAQPARKYTGEPYIVHPIEVMGLIVAYADPHWHDFDTLAVAIGHDLYEDTLTTRKEVCDLFGAEVDFGIWELTDQVPKEAGNRRARKAMEAERLGSISAMAQTVKCADLISNSRTIVPLDPGFARVYIPEKRAVLEALTRADPSIHAAAMETLAASERKLAA